MMSNGESNFSEIEDLINALNVRFEDPVEEPQQVVEEMIVPKESEPGFDMSFKEREITIGLLLETIDDMQDYINELLGELKKSNEDRAKLNELEEKNKALEQALVDIRSFNSAHNAEDTQAKELSEGHDLLGRRGKILVLLSPNKSTLLLV